MPEYHIYIGADHRGFEKKEQLFPMLSGCHENVIVEDLGALEYNEADDFNDPALAVAKAVAGDKFSFGVLLCGSAHGVCMQANRVKGARAINAATEESVRAGREEDNANILCLPADKLDVDKMEKLVKSFCHTRPLLEERYVRRASRLDDEIVAADDALKTVLGGDKRLVDDSDRDSSEEE